MSKSPLLSIIATNRNDLYHGNQLQRTKFILNYLTYSLKKMNSLDKVEYIIVDWGSDEPFSNYFYDEIHNCSSIKFINVPKEETLKCSLDFDQSEALNIGINYSLGEHVMLTSSDQFFPLSVFNNMLNILEKPEIYGIKGDDYKLVPRKLLEDDFFIYETSMEKVDQYFQKLNQSAISYSDFPVNSGGGAGGNLLKKKQWIKINGIKQTKIHNRGQDLISLHETSKICSHIDTSTFGSYLLKLPRTKKGFRKTQIKEMKNQLDFLSFKNDEGVINSQNIEIKSSSNLPKKKINFNQHSIAENEQSIKIIEIIKTIFDCVSFTNFSKLNLTSQDILFILDMKRAIIKNKIKTVFFDEIQSARFATSLTNSFKDLQIFIFMNPKKNNSIDILKFRTSMTYHLYKKNPKYYGKLKVVELDKETTKFINKLDKVCTIQENILADTPSIKNEFHQQKINVIREVVNNTKKIKYNVEGIESFKQKKPKILASDFLLIL